MVKLRKKIARSINKKLLNPIKELKRKTNNFDKIKDEKIVNKKSSNLIDC